MSKSQIDYLDPRTDNYFGYDQEEDAWVLVQSWIVWLHFEGTPEDKYELGRFRAARKYLEEPTDKDFKLFANQSKQLLEEHMAIGVFSADVDEDGNPNPRKFDQWKIADYREDEVRNRI